MLAALAAEVDPQPSAVSNRVDVVRVLLPAIVQLERQADGISTARPTQLPAFRRHASQSIFEAINNQLSKQKATSHVLGK